MKKIPLLLASFVICSMAVPAFADSITILSETGTVGGGPPVSGSQSNIAQSQFVGLSFVLGSAFQDVSISVPDVAYVDWTATAWLTNAIGQGTTSANVIATATASPFPGGLGIATTTFMSNLTLSPGTYFFFLSSPFCSATDFSDGCGFGLWPTVSDATIIAAPGASLFGQEIVGGISFSGCILPNCSALFPDFAFPAASRWKFSNDIGPSPLAIDITGTPVPEPASLMLLGTGLLGLWGAALRKRLPAHS